MSVSAACPRCERGLVVGPSGGSKFKVGPSRPRPGMLTQIRLRSEDSWRDETTNSRSRVCRANSARLSRTQLPLSGLSWLTDLRLPSLSRERSSEHGQSPIATANDAKTFNCAVDHLLFHDRADPRNICAFRLDLLDSTFHHYRLFIDVSRLSRFVSPPFQRSSCFRNRPVLVRKFADSWSFAGNLHFTPALWNVLPKKITNYLFGIKKIELYLESFIRSPRC